MKRRIRSLTPPVVLMLAFSAGQTGCDTEAGRRRHAEEAKRNQAWEDGQRRQAETAPPTPEVMEQVRAATQAFLGEHHPALQVEGFTLTSLTPNLFLVGVPVLDGLQGNRYVAQFTAERLRDVTEDDEGEGKENGQFLWVVDYVEPARMQELARRHGFAPEVDRIRDLGEGRPGASWGRRTWLDDYLLWHFLFNRPRAFGCGPGGGFSPMAPGYRFQDPGRPITDPDAAPFWGAAAPTGGRSMVFLGGSAWRPPLVSHVSSLPGQAFVAGAHGGIAGRAPMGSVSRGGFGAAGHAAGTGG